MKRKRQEELKINTRNLELFKSQEPKFTLQSELDETRPAKHMDKHGLEGLLDKLKYSEVVRPYLASRDYEQRLKRRELMLRRVFPRFPPELTNLIASKEIEKPKDYQNF